MPPDELGFPLNTPQGQILLGARDVIAEEAFAVDLGSVELAGQVAAIELWAQCTKCQRESIFAGATTADAIHAMRSSGWVYDESAQQSHLCPECLEGVYGSETGGGG